MHASPFELGVGVVDLVILRICGDLGISWFEELELDRIALAWIPHKCNICDS